MKKFVIASLFFAPLVSFAQVNFESSNLPIVLLNTNGQAIPDDNKINIQMQVIDNGPGQLNHIGDPPNHFDNTVGIKLRGSTSNWFSDKKPYAVEIRDADDEDLNFPLLGMPAESDWAFLAPFNDKSLIREAFIYNLARNVMPWASRTRFVELVLNGDYQGIYLVTERIKRGKNRVDIAKLGPEEISGDDLTGGYILKMDKTSGSPSDGWVSPFPPAPGAWQTTLWQVEYPKVGNLQPEQKAYIEAWITEFETIMDSPDFADPDMGYPRYIDVQSFLDFTLLNELAKNVDAYRLSTFFHKDKDSKDPRLHAGPIWDFNIGFGNANYCTAENPDGWIIDFNQFCPDDGWIIHFWWKKLWEDPTYRTQLKERWATLREGPLSNERIYNMLDSLSGQLQEAQVRNFQRFPVLNSWVWPNVFCCGTYEQHLGFLQNWLTLRLQWMDNALQSLPTEAYEAEKFAPTQVFPNPVSTGVVHFKCYTDHAERIQVQVYDPRGSRVRTLDFVPEAPGERVFEWKYGSLPPGVYFYDIRSQNAVESAGRIVILK